MTKALEIRDVVDGRTRWTVEQAEDVADLFWPELIDDHGAVFLLSGRLANAAPLYKFADLMEAECAVNHVHILDELEHQARLDTHPFWNAAHPDFHRAISLAAVIAECWAAALASHYPNRDFAIIATRDDSPSVRFHQIRADDRIWLDPDDLTNLGPGAAFIIVIYRGRVSGRYGSLEAGEPST